MGIVLLFVLLLSWVKGHQDIVKETFLRRKMIRLAIKKYDDNRTFTKKDQAILDNLSKDSVVEGESLKADVKEYAKEIIDSEHDEKEFADKELELRKKDPKYKL